MRIYAIGDVHGRVDLLDAAFARIDANLTRSAPDRVVHILLGDYVDRGPSSREVLDRLVERARAHHMICLKGNHESYLVEFLHDPSVLGDWRHFGGLETLRSYGLNPSANPSGVEEQRLANAFATALPGEHRQLLKKLGASFSCGDFFFAHAGVKPGIPLAQQSEHDLLWIRDDFLLSEQDFGKVIVHGHTPVLQPEFRPNRINIDTGAYATGRLTCLMIERDGIFVL
ncbi:MAG: serine/threonine protein phosphatase [Hyphomicrobiales bacterium]|nr:serine/threonine protein phosphatase [Hyphomicrobiales bacterium]